MSDTFLPFDDLKKGVLYIVLSDQKRIELYSDNIRTYAKTYLDSSEHVPENVRKALDFQRCSVCPFVHEAGYCHALYPTLSIFDIVDKYPSYEKVRIYYLDPVSSCLLVKNTSLQDSLRYVSILSLIHYCELGREYHDYFFMVTPLMSLPDIATRIYLNVLWLNGGDKDLALAKVNKFIDELRITIGCQINRLRLISKNDAYLNTFASTHVLTDLMKLDIVEVVKLNFKEHQHHIWDDQIH